MLQGLPAVLNTNPLQYIMLYILIRIAHLEIVVTGVQDHTDIVDVRVEVV